MNDDQGVENSGDVGGLAVPDLSAYLPLLSEIGDLKRIRAAGFEGSMASRLFRDSWSGLASKPGEALDMGSTARSTTAAALCAAKLGAVDGRILGGGGLSEDESREIMLASFDAVSSPLPEPLRRSLRSEVSQGSQGSRDLEVGLGSGSAPNNRAPGFVGALARQPRAGATRPGRPRLMLEPPENHAEHCVTVAVYGVILSGVFGADPGQVFAAGLSHHLHNAGLPDSGFAGEELLGKHLERVAGKFREAALAELADPVRREVEPVIALAGHAESPEARAFNAADVLDRVLQMRHYERQAGFTLDQALEGMDLVHPGPLKDFQDSVLAGAGVF